MSDFKYFKRDEFACSETGGNEIKDDFVLDLDDLREVCGFPFVITSGYRAPEHSIEAAKDEPGQHTTGHCADIAVANGRQRFTLVSEALKAGFTGIGVGKDFVHLDQRNGIPVMWTY